MAYRIKRKTGAYSAPQAYPGYWWTGPQPAFSGYPGGGCPCPQCISLSPPQPAPIYLFPPEHATIRVPDPPVKLWEGTHRSFEGYDYMVPASVTVKGLIEALGGDKDSSITECIEKGNYKFVKGISLKHKDDKAKKTLGELGWGECSEPVILVMLSGKEKEK